MYSRLNENWANDKIEKIRAVVNGQAQQGTVSLGSLKITDISDLSRFKAGGRAENKAFVVHHTAGRGTAQGVVDVLNKRGLGVQWVVDRSGNIFRTLPSGSVGGQILNSDKYAPPSSGTRGLNNRNTEGVEVIANNDADILPVQVEAVRALTKALGYKPWQVVPHGVVNMGHKEEDEGYTICRAICPDCYADAKTPLGGKWLGAYLAGKLRESSGGKTLVIGDSHAVGIGSSIPSVQVDKNLATGGWTLSNLMEALTNHPGSEEITNIVISIGTNGHFSPNDDIAGLVSLVTQKFPNAKIYAFGGSYGWSGKMSIEEVQNRFIDYYKRFVAAGVNVLPHALGYFKEGGDAHSTSSKQATAIANDIVELSAYK